MKVEKLSLEEVLPIRQEVLWSDKPLSYCYVDGDETAQHFGIKIHGEVVCVASIYRDKDTARLRKFATKSAFQRQGLGTLVLDFLVEYLQSQGITLLWFDARETAIPFYKKKGFTVQGERFYKGGIAYFVMNRHLT